MAPLRRTPPPVRPEARPLQGVQGSGSGPRSLRAEVLETLVQSSSSHSTVEYDPSEWYQQALDVVKIVADDRYGIHQALGGTAALKDILTKLAETAISKLVISAGVSR